MSPAEMASFASTTFPSIIMVLIGALSFILWSIVTDLKRDVACLSRSVTDLRLVVASLEAKLSGENISNDRHNTKGHSYV